MQTSIPRRARTTEFEVRALLPAAALPSERNSVGAGNDLPRLYGVFRVIALIDMDAFYASIEQRDCPELRGKPVIVGSPPNQRGVVCAASYEARKFGVRSAMPSVTAGRLCPSGIFIRPDMARYRAESELVMQIVAWSGAIIEQVSIDEAYLDLTALCQGNSADESLQRAVPAARKIKENIRTERHLTASIGLGSNKLLAKLASDQEKPDGLTVIPEARKVQILRPLPIRVLHGVGEVTAEQLRQIGITTVGDLQDYRGNLKQILGGFAHTLKRFALGEDDRPLDLSSDPKSISSENTFLRDTDDRQILRRTLRQQASEIAAELEQKRLAARTVEVRVRYGDFTTLNRQLTFEDATADADAIYRFGCHLLARHKLVDRPLRLLGLGVSNLGAPDLQLLLPLK